jgi:hypothetical protein
MKLVGSLSEKEFSLDELVVKVKELFATEGMAGVVGLMLNRNRAVRHRGMSYTSGASDSFGQLSARYGLNGGDCVVRIADGR